MNKDSLLANMQEQYMNKDAVNEERKKIHESWFDEGTVDFWRHKRMYQTIQPVAEYYKENKWLTIGDGRFGLDTIRLKKLFNLRDILPTDIAGNMLEISKQQGLIAEYSVQNAEKLSFPDSSFDVIFCKEAFHHFPRPYLALYEMIRVAKKAVVLIEPAEKLAFDGIKSKDYLRSGFKLVVSKIFKRFYIPYIPGNNQLTHSFEESGNYLYSVSVREMEKLIHGLDLDGMAYLRFNDAYIKGCEFENAERGNEVFEEMQTSLEKGDELCEKYPHVHQPNMVTVVLFKDKIEAALQNKMQEHQFTFVNKTDNPYL